MHAQHHAAALTRLREGVLADKVHSGLRFTNDGQPARANYVGVTTTLPSYSEAPVTSPQAPLGDSLLLVRTRTVAVDYDGLLLLQGAVDGRLVGYRLEVEGRSITPFERFIDEPRYDNTTRLWYVDATYEATSSRT